MYQFIQYLAISMQMHGATALYLTLIDSRHLTYLCIDCIYIYSMYLHQRNAMSANYHTNSFYQWGRKVETHPESAHCNDTKTKLPIQTIYTIKVP